MWPKIRYWWYKLFRKDIRYIFVPTKEAYKHYKIIELCIEKKLIQDDFSHCNWKPPVIGSEGIWVVDNQNLVKDRIKLKKREVTQYLKDFDERYPFKPMQQHKTIRETIVEAINSNKTVH